MDAQPASPPRGALREPATADGPGVGPLLVLDLEPVDRVVDPVQVEPFLVAQVGVRGDVSAGVLDPFQVPGQHGIGAGPVRMALLCLGGESQQEPSALPVGHLPAGAGAADPLQRRVNPRTRDAAADVDEFLAVEQQPVGGMVRGDAVAPVPADLQRAQRPPQAERVGPDPGAILQRELRSLAPVPTRQLDRQSRSRCRCH